MSMRLVFWASTNRSLLLAGLRLCLVSRHRPTYTVFRKQTQTHQTGRSETAAVRGLLALCGEAPQDSGGSQRCTCEMRGRNASQQPARPMRCGAVPTRCQEPRRAPSTHATPAEGPMAGLPGLHSGTTGQSRSHLCRTYRPGQRRVGTNNECRLSAFALRTGPDLEKIRGRRLATIFDNLRAGSDSK